MSKTIIFLLIILSTVTFNALCQNELSHFEISNISASSAQVNWQNNQGTSSYKLKYRPKEAIYWNYFISTIYEKTLLNLLPDCLYEVQLIAIDHSGAIKSSAIQSFRTKIPRPDHIVMLIMENQSYGAIISSPAAPYINKLVKNPLTALFSNSHGLQHPSQPNYLHLFSGSNQGMNSNDKPTVPFTTPNLFGYLYQSGISFKCYSEDLPLHGYNGEFNGAYARKHNPVTNWMGTDTNQVPHELNAPFTQFPENLNNLPEFCYVIPNQDNDMHNGTYPSNIITGDAWIRKHLDKYVQWALNNNSLLIITFDEDNWVDKNRIATLFYGPMINGGLYNDSICHYHVLRTLEEIYDLPYAGNSAYANAINCWKNNPSMDSNPLPDKESSILSNFNFYPNPASNSLSITFNLNNTASVTIELFDIKGQKIRTSEVEFHAEPGFYERIISTEKIPQGICFVRLSAGDERYERKLAIYH